MVRLCFVIDTTGSMNNYLQALQRYLVEIIALSSLIGMDSIGILTYSDYSETIVTKWSGWKKNYKDIKDFIGTLHAHGGDDYPEAVRTAIYDLSKIISENANEKTIVIWYTDAPPHISSKYSKVVC